MGKLTYGPVFIPEGFRQGYERLKRRRTRTNTQGKGTKGVTQENRGNIKVPKNSQIYPKTVDNQPKAIV